MHPLASLARRVLVQGNINFGLTGLTDSNGNPVFSEKLVRLQIMVMTVRDQVLYRNVYTVESLQGRKFVTLYALRIWDITTGALIPMSIRDFRPETLGDELIAVDGQVKFSIIDRNQSNLLPITEVFGKKMLALQSGNL